MDDQRPYCPTCGALLEDVDEESGICWGVCALAGIRQPAIHLCDVVIDTYEMRNGFGEMIRIETVVRPVHRRGDAP